MKRGELTVVLEQYVNTRAGQLTALELQQICIQRKNLYTDALMAGEPPEVVNAIQKHFFKAQEMYNKAVAPAKVKGKK